MAFNRQSTIRVYILFSIIKHKYYQLFTLWFIPYLHFRILSSYLCMYYVYESMIKWNKWISNRFLPKHKCLLLDDLICNIVFCYVLKHLSRHDETTQHKLHYFLGFENVKTQEIFFIILLCITYKI